MASTASSRVSQSGFSYLEALAAVALTAMLLTILTRVVGNVLEAHDSARTMQDTLEESRFALERMMGAVSRSGRLLVPQAENSGTGFSESIRDPGVLAVPAWGMRSGPRCCPAP